MTSAVALRGGMLDFGLKGRKFKTYQNLMFWAIQHVGFFQPERKNY